MRNKFSYSSDPPWFQFDPTSVFAAAELRDYSVMTLKSRPAYPGAQAAAYHPTDMDLQKKKSRNQIPECLQTLAVLMRLN